MMEDKQFLEDIPGVGRVTAKRLRDAGILSIKHLSLYTIDELVDITGMDPIRLSSILSYARKIIGFKVNNASSYMKYRSSLPRITTGVNGLDRILQGGLEARAIYEFAGEFGTGKTQICHQLAVTVQLTRNRGGIGGSCLYIDTEGTFSPPRIKDIAERFEIENVLENIYTIEAINVDHLIECIRTEAVNLVEKNNVSLIIIDSLISHFRAEYTGREKLALRQQRLNYLIDWLLRIARVYNVYIVVTNQVMDVPNAWRAGQKIPTGGNIIAHGMTHRILLTRERGVEKAMIIDSPYLPYGDFIYFEIYEGGVRDVDKK